MPHPQPAAPCRPTARLRDCPGPTRPTVPARLGSLPSRPLPQAHAVAVPARAVTWVRHFVLVLAAAWLLAACAAEGRRVAGPAATAPLRVLYFTLSAGYRHEVIPESEAILRALGERSGRFRVTVSQDPALLRADVLAGYDVLVFYTTGELPIDTTQKQALLDFVAGGKGFVGVHSASDTFYQWPGYGRMLGGYFDGHPWHQPVRIRTEDRAHPATRHLPPMFGLHDEIYQFKAWSRGDVQVLLSLDPASVDLAAAGVHRTDRDFALAWTRRQGKGRVFYTALGHRPEVWRDDRFQQMLVEAIAWAGGNDAR